LTPLFAAFLYEKTYMKNKILFLVMLALLPFPAFGEETINCSVQPQSQIIKENASVTFSFSGQEGDASRATLGGLPGGVTGEFVDDDTLRINALAGAQLGSFDISILYDLQNDDSLVQSACSFNLIVSPSTSRDVTQEYIPLPSHETVPVTIERGVITVEPRVDETYVEEIEENTGEIFVSPLYIGLHGEEVVKLQSVLKEAGYFPSWVDTTGYYGEITEKAVAEFQSDNEIISVGFVGPLTRAALNSKL